MNTILVVVLIVLLIGALPTWPYSANWGYYPSGGFGTGHYCSVGIAIDWTAFLGRSLGSDRREGFASARLVK